MKKPTEVRLAGWGRSLLCVLLFLSVPTGLPFRVLAQAPDWGVDPGTFPFSMNITAAVFVDGVQSGSIDNVLGVFVGEEVRGVATPLRVNEATLYFTTVYGIANGERVSFKLYDAASGEVRDGAQAVIFQSNAIWGTPASPYRLDIGEDPSVNDPATWEVNPAGYAFSMAVTARVYLDGEMAASPDVRLAAFAGSEVRGIAAPEETSVAQGEVLFFLSIYSNVEGESLTLRVLNPAGDSVYVFEESLLFEANAVLGSPDRPFVVTNGAETHNERSPESAGVSGLEVFPNPAIERVAVKFHVSRPASLRLVAYDLLGRQVRVIWSGFVSKGEYRTSWTLVDDRGRTLSPGVYLLRLEGPATKLTTRLLVRP